MIIDQEKFKVCDVATRGQHLSLTHRIKKVYGLDVTLEAIPTESILSCLNRGVNQASVYCSTMETYTK